MTETNAILALIELLPSFTDKSASRQDLLYKSLLLKRLNHLQGNLRGEAYWQDAINEYVGCCYNAQQGKVEEDFLLDDQPLVS